MYLRFSLLGIVCAITACTSDRYLYESWEWSRIENCKQQFSPYDPELEYCIEQARLPYDEYAKQRKGTDDTSDQNVK